MMIVWIAMIYIHLQFHWSTTSSKKEYRKCQVCAEEKITFQTSDLKKRKIKFIAKQEKKYHRNWKSSATENCVDNYVF